MIYAVDFVKKTKIREFGDLSRKLEKEGKKIVKAYIGTPKYKDTRIFNILNLALEYYVSGRISSNIDDSFLYDRFEQAKCLIDLCKKETNPHFYSDFRGMENIRKVIGEIEGRDYKEAFITNGAMEGLFITLVTLASQKNVLLPEISFHPYYKYMALLASAKPYKYSTIDEAIEKIETEKYSTIVIASPNNPDGTVASETELKRLVDTAASHNTWVIVDRVYKNLALVGNVPAPPRAENVIETYSISKDVGFPGIRGGVVLGTKEAIEKIAIVALPIRASVNNLTQIVLGVSYQNLDLVKNRRNELIDKLNGLIRSLSQNIEYTQPKGGLYLWLRVNKDGYNFALDLLHKKQIAVAPGCEFNFDSPSNYPYIRVTFGALTAEQTSIVGEAISDIYEQAEQEQRSKS